MVRTIDVTAEYEVGGGADMFTGLKVLITKIFLLSAWPLIVRKSDSTTKKEFKNGYFIL